ncbi:MAG: 50S ribosomal protein L5 [Candidatus Jacksonbacteria bacterium]|jgi:large subunit ribosomal protein L5|nr:50S ribosomal protein L5 [Candidatus Jacksonbacteria bacterium]MBT6034081.1 50S ribosomal protein L5 [Candidatus Jacksonbacteria bacterium]MBT6301116.1 50S ribosomal protein L5 [Candidatus Jacksonbacteria bacterium]MBT6757301.1 50S ribosomal protein L5 [Candidatus Jacksonbacteria bacterium]MBT6955618.1 50S ribosomal protein L5 [Candidatus Jacksonbacteria bacterium]
MTNILNKKTLDEKLIKKLEVSNPMALPKFKKITINAGVGKFIKDKNMLEVVRETLTQVSGQKPVETKARKSIAGFKVREGNVVGYMATLRGKRMYDFLARLVNVTLPRVRDFRGIPLSSVDREGNLSIGIKEHSVFPEVDQEKVHNIHGLQLTITVDANSRDEAIELYRAIGIPFAKKEL